MHYVLQHHQIFRLTKAQFHDLAFKLASGHTGLSLEHDFGARFTHFVSLDLDHGDTDAAVHFLNTSDAKTCAALRDDRATQEAEAAALDTRLAQAPQSSLRGTQKPSAPQHLPPAKPAPVMFDKPRRLYRRG